MIDTLVSLMKLTKISLALLASSLAISAPLCRQAQASQLSGEISFAGTVQLNNTSAGNSSGVIGWHGAGGAGSPIVTDATDDFGMFVSSGDPVTFLAPWSFNSGSLANFWTVGGFTFSLSSSSIESQTAPTRHDKAGRWLDGSVTVVGTGFVFGNGFSNTLVDFTFITQDSGNGALATFSFTDPTAPSAVPDSGGTVALLGLSLAGIGLVRWKLRCS